MNNTLRRVAVIGGVRIPFCRSNTFYADRSNLEMLIATLNGLVDKYGLKGAHIDEAVGGAVVSHSKDWNLAREAVLGTKLSPSTPGVTLVQACGTSTEVSLPCMFAPIGRRDYDEKRIRNEQSLLHVLARVGIGVYWIDNQSGCKGVCAGLSQERIPGDADPAFCDGERCLDGILLPRLAAKLKTSPGDLVVVLHMLGNHGPAYSRRYPPEFRRFVPTCESLELSECSQDEILNAYDNAILYTDHVLASLVHYLETQTDRDAGLIYVSDHGESLGESGFYLHGLPYRIAPAVQREVPMLVWLSDNLQRDSGLSTACLRQGVSSDVSHDHLFHSVLGLLQVETAAREPTLDLFTPCRVPAVMPATSQEPRGPAIP